MGHYLAGQVVGMAIGFVAGAFFPAVLRKIKSAFVAETKGVESKLQAGAQSAIKKL